MTKRSQRSPNSPSTSPLPIPNLTPTTLPLGPDKVGVSAGFLGSGNFSATVLVGDWIENEHETMVSSTLPHSVASTLGEKVLAKMPEKTISCELLEWYLIKGKSFGVHQPAMRRSLGLFWEYYGARLANEREGIAAEINEKEKRKLELGEDFKSWARAFRGQTRGGRR